MPALERAWRDPWLVERLERLDHRVGVCAPCIIGHLLRDRELSERR